MFDYIPAVFKGQYAETEEEADQWLKDNDSARRTPDLLPRDEVARAINSEVKAGRGTPHGGVYLDIATRMTPEEIKRRLPSMYHQFMELAEVDITKDEMEVGPTCHYVMGGIEVDPDTGARGDPGSVRRRRVLRRHARLEPARRQLAVGPAGVRPPRRPRRRRLRAGAAEPAEGLRGVRRRGRRDGAGAVRGPQRPGQAGESVHAARRTAADDERPGRHHPQGRRDPKRRWPRSTNSRPATATSTSEGGREFNPGWHLAIDMRNMLLVSECVAKAALRAPKAGAGTPATTTRRWTPSGATRCWCAGSPSGDRRGDRPRASRSPRKPAADARGSARGVRTRRAGEVLHRRRTGRSIRDGRAK